MVSINIARELALGFDEVTEAPHFDRRAFKVKKIFATMLEADKTMNVKLSPLDQDVFCTFDATVIHPVPNAWGRQGWTTIHLGKVRKAMLRDILTVAYCTAAPKKLADKYRTDE